MKYSTLALTALIAGVADAALPLQPPPLAGAGLPDFDVPSTCSFLYGDPHILTWDNQHSDCMSDGDFLLAKSSTSDFEVQSRFYEATEEMQAIHFAERGWHVGTGTKAIVVNTGDANEPVIEVNAEVPLEDENGRTWHGGKFLGCALKYYVNGELLELDDDTHVGDYENVHFQRTQAVEPNIWHPEETNTNYYRNFYFKDSGVFLQVKKSYWDRYGCYMDARICIPDEIKGQNLYGILGDADGNKENDFKTKFHDQFTPFPWSNSEKQEWCEENWCVKDDDESMFHDPDILNGCQSNHAEELDEAVNNASDEIKEQCHHDIECIEDTIITGDINVGRETLQSKMSFEEGKNIGGTVTTDNEDGVCFSGEGNPVMCESYEFEFHCEAIRGYDFGYKMDGCDSNADGSFKNLFLTDENPTCQVGNYDIGSFSIDCGADGTDVTLTPTVQSVVKISGATKGTLYSHLAAGETYILSTAQGDEKEMIEQIEFCFKCPSFVVDGEIVTCEMDVKNCDDGTSLTRDPENGCNFAECPPPPASNCAALWKQCGGKDWTGTTSCYEGAHCVESNEWWSGCKLHQPDPNTVPFDAQCGRGDQPYDGNTRCTSGSYCEWKDPWWSHCKPDPEARCPADPKTGDEPLCAATYKKCGGKNWNGPTECMEGNTCLYINEFFSQCAPNETDEGAVAIHKQCGRGDHEWDGNTKCTTGTYCEWKDPWWSHCKPDPNAICPAEVKAAEPEPCPAAMPQLGAECNFEGSCDYGEETCCDGSTAPSVTAKCSDGTVAGNSVGCSVICAPTADFGECKDMAVDVKCPLDHPDRMHRLEGQTLETCHDVCVNTEGCDYYSFSANGDNNGHHQGVCMGCTKDDAKQTHLGFNLYSVNCLGEKALTEEGIKDYEAPAPEEEEPEPVVCAADVHQCSDGSFVSRVGEDCQFEDCPAEPKTGGPNLAPPKASGSGDPHFKTWTGDKFDYHGECDLVLLDNPSFNDGQGLKIHIRTTRVKYFSFIEKVAIQIGEEVLEFDNDVENFMINGKPVEENQMHHKTMIAGYVVRRDARALSLRLIDDKSAAARQNHMIAKIDLHTRKNGFPAVILDGGHTAAFKGSLGLLGEWKTGRKLGRDGKTEFEVDPENASDFALEWQVRDTEPMLFSESRFPQFPTICTPPATIPGGRLGMAKAKLEAEEACGHWKEDMEDCIFDVIATRDVLVAAEGHIVHVE